MPEKVRLEHSSVMLMSHDPFECSLQSACPLHHRTDHQMREYPQHWRSDRGIIERICPHGIGHPDPDQFPFWASRGVLETEALHGCDGCCAGESHAWGVRAGLEG